ncbi:hypothetical protein TPHV1_10257 [Treponema phagedenis]|uniref:Uncharacterized protein n=1 Tax=Treponema phagedenis TaxID=162 RepID=A0A0B7GPU8_TREPH|nr:hypothetical protein TPHV1_10257 [Treponema phagedenis]
MIGSLTESGQLRKSLQILTIVNACQTEINTSEEAELILKTPTRSVAY